MSLKAADVDRTWEKLGYTNTTRILGKIAELIT